MTQHVTGGRALEEMAPGVPALIANWCGWRNAEYEDDYSSRETENLTQAEQLLRYAEERAELFHDPDGQAYATVRLDNHSETYSTKSERFKDWLLLQFYRANDKAPKSASVTDALAT